jgi:hypothetical protein
MSDTPAGPAAPSLFLGLVNLAGRMAAPIEGGGVNRLEKAQRLFDLTVEHVCLSYTRSDKPAVDLGVALVGYQTGPDGTTYFRPLLPGTREPEREWYTSAELVTPPSGRPTAWVPATRLSKRSAESRPFGPRRWCEINGAALDPTAEASPVEALRMAHRLVTRWLRCQPRCAPPLVVHCLDDSPPGAEVVFLIRSLRALATATGPVGAIHCLLGPSLARSSGTLPADPRLFELWEASSPLPRAHHPISNRRGTLVDRLPVGPIARLLRGSPELPEAFGDGPPQVSRLHPLMEAKEGPVDESQDSYSQDSSAGLFAVTDGAAQGFQVQTWARLLAARFVQLRPALDDLDSLAAWVSTCRAVWLQTFDLTSVRPGQQEMYHRFGGSATFIGLQVGEADSTDGTIPWRAWAVGDACVFHLRDGAVRLSFPLADPDAFSAAPLTLRTKHDMPLPRPLLAAGRGLPGDVIALATDAVSNWIVKTVVQGERIDWNAIWHSDSEAWAVRVDELRNSQPRALKIDDSTLMLIELGPPPPVVADTVVPVAIEADAPVENAPVPEDDPLPTVGEVEPARDEEDLRVANGEA